MEKLLHMGIKRHTQECLAALFKKQKARKKIQISINVAMNRMVLHIYSTDYNSAIKMNELQLHATMQNDDSIFFS